MALHKYRFGNGVDVITESGGAPYGDPNGRITADPGAIYSAPDSPATAWLKETGVGTNTGWVQFGTGSVTVTQLGGLGITIDGQGSALTTGVKGFLRAPYGGTITRVTLLSIDASATSGDIVMDVWKDSYANYPPTVADTITASAKPTLSSANKYEDATLTGWTTSFSAGDVFGFKIDSVSGLTKVILILHVTKS